MAPRPRRIRPRGRAGMTLIELLAAMAIFLGLAGMVLQVLGGGLELWSSGERRRDESEQAGALLDRLSAELRHLVSSDGGDGEPRVKLLCDFIARDADSDGTREFRAQRLVFVRRLIEERTSTVLRRAGTTAGAAVPFTGAVPADAADLLPTEGLVETGYVLLPDVRAGYEGRAVLWRALRSPIGGKDSLFAHALKDDAGLDEAGLEPVAENVLWLGYSFLDDSVQDATREPGPGGPLVVWDSTRGLLPAGEGFSGFRHARGQGSLGDPDDDVFPAAIRLEVVTVPPPGESPQAELAGDVPASGGTVRVELRNGTFLRRLGAGARVLKLGHEWVEVGETDGQTLLVVKRGLFGTAPAVHGDGTKVLVGRRFERVVPLPAARSDLVSRDLERRRP